MHLFVSVCVCLNRFEWLRYYNGSSQHMLSAWRSRWLAPIYRLQRANIQLRFINNFVQLNIIELEETASADGKKIESSPFSDFFHIITAN